MNNYDIIQLQQKIKNQEQEIQKLKLIITRLQHELSNKENQKIKPYEFTNDFKVHLDILESTNFI
ncbi:hypothetical protein crov086 [Cafeteria roenbergensis virus]|uniref:Uncharacterized protein n=1 Tax=Cafeteria roenbergensis virus (strain BV-PW1) TaxID=693272 RepID=E3T4K6_CROVB|nr:hypothetical protein crov086 [Cafeteria roenbergensis virus BV-PW1]ADO67119.1 hypothetical protein crov086 [Cafeteria roenbergensis virus BV-PW1]